MPNTLAIDTNTGVFYITVNIPSEPSSIVAALRYTGGSTPTIEPVWQSSVLTGGSGASIVISADGTRLYGNDGADNTYALDAATAELLWLYPIGPAQLQARFEIGMQAFCTVPARADHRRRWPARTLAGKPLRQ